MYSLIIQRWHEDHFLAGNTIDPNGGSSSWPSVIIEGKLSLLIGESTKSTTEVAYLPLAMFDGRRNYSYKTMKF